jgi:hypothetical protein
MKKLSLALLTIAAALFTGACQPDVPFAPLFETDVKPLFMSQCVRCHGAGEMLRPDPTIPGRKPTSCYLDHLEDVGPGCTSTPVDLATCQRGVLNPLCMAFLQGYFPATMPKRTDPARMPPPPSEVLNDWEHEVIVRWLANPLP